MASLAATRPAGIGPPRRLGRDGPVRCRGAGGRPSVDGASMVLAAARSRSGDGSGQLGLPLVWLRRLTVVLIDRQRLPRRANYSSGDGA